MSPATEYRGGVHGARGVDLHALVEALLKVEPMQERDFRVRLVKLIGRELGGALAAAESGNARAHIAEIVRACEDRPGGIAALSRCLSSLAGEDGDVLLFAGLASPIPPVVRPEDEARLREVLEGIAVAEVPRLFNAAVDGTVAMSDMPRNAWDAFARLADTNVRADDVPPHLLFVDMLASLLARGTEGEADSRAAVLRAWVTKRIDEYEQGDDRDLADRVRRLGAQAAVADGPGLPMTLIVLLEPDLRGPGDRYVVTRWRQLDPVRWRPERDGGELVVRAAEIPGTVASLLRAAERDWAGWFGGSLDLELILPNELLNLAADQWLSEEDDESLAVPIGAEYGVVLRSLQRLRERAWYRHWIGRSQALGGLEHTLHRCPPGLEGDARKLRLHLDSMKTVVAYVLSSSPDEEPGRTELPAVLRVGLPVVLWSRDPEALADLWEAVAGGPLHTLRDVVKTLRRDAALGDGTSAKCGHHISLIWDSFDSFIALAEPLVSSSL